MDSRGLKSLVDGSEPSFDSIRSPFRFNRFRRYMNPAASAAKMTTIPRKTPDMNTKPIDENISGKLGEVQCEESFSSRNQAEKKEDSWR
ncbi:unnamed protein product [Microthlaspi erraticum]|uniref:Uncharacterized protein n=1 Tax=Microthlaspi erraticum TaxID=1685480 RepID=A0A6D2ISI0_9BRAS|nr:unnamed protein product [Microthlaspi erraticum]